MSPANLNVKRRFLNSPVGRRKGSFAFRKQTKDAEYHLFPKLPSQLPTFKPNARREKARQCEIGRCKVLNGHRTLPDPKTTQPLERPAFPCHIFNFPIPPPKDPEISAPVCHHNFLSSIAIQVKKVHVESVPTNGQGWRSGDDLQPSFPSVKPPDFQPLIFRHHHDFHPPISIQSATCGEP